MNQSIMDNTGKFLLLVSGVLGCIASILAAVYAYVYYTRIKPQHRKTLRTSRHQIQQPQGHSGRDADQLKMIHPLLLGFGRNS